MDGPENYADDKKKFINFMKANVMYDHILGYLSPQLNFLGY
jgi:hypothetical protein